MADTVDKATRSRMMSGIRGKDTKPEWTVRRYLHRQGFRYSLNNKKLPGNPDIVLKKHRAAILVHGCFWHRHDNCRYAYTPKSRTEFWQAKFEKNVVRDRVVADELSDNGWRVATVWECCLRNRKSRQAALHKLTDWITSSQQTIEIPSSAEFPSQ